MISLITVTYNAERTLGRTLESVSRQSQRGFEHVIIDGASKDGTMALVESYAAENTDIKVISVSEPDKGLYDAMNKGLAKASGDYVCFLNAGDKLHDADTLYYINKIAERAGTPAPAVIYGETDIVDDKGQFIRHRRLSSPEKLTWKSFRHGMVVCHQSFYALRSLATPYDLTYRFSADFDWCVRLMKAGAEKGYPMVNSHRILTDYLSEGMTTQNHKASLKERFRIMAKHYGWLVTAAMHGWFVLRSILYKLGIRKPWSSKCRMKTSFHSAENSV